MAVLYVGNRTEFNDDGDDFFSESACAYDTDKLSVDQIKW